MAYGGQYVVGNSADSGAGSLREAISAASAGDTIRFDTSTDGAPIMLSSTISFSKTLTFIGNGKDLTIIDGSGFDLNLFSVSARCNFYNLTMQNGGKPLGNSPTNWGGAIFYEFSSDTLLIENCRFKNNLAYLGGAIRIQEGEMVLMGCEFNGNQSIKFGGAINARSSSGNNALLVNCLFYDNHTNEAGGAIYAESNNHWKIINSTFAGNSSDTNGGGFRNAGTSSFYLYNSVFFNNTAVSGGPDIQSSTPTAASNNILNDYSGSGFSSGFNGNLQGNPGFVDAASDDYRLNINSLAKDAGNQTFLPAGTLNDLLGSGRIAGSETDMGAFEFQPMLYTKTNANGNKNGSSWTHAYTDLQKALAAATQGTVIWVSAGTYKPTPGTDRGISFEIPDSVKVYGGFNGGEASNFNLDNRNISFYKTILSGDIGQTADSLDNSYNVIYTKNVSAFTEVNGFSIMHGYGTINGGRSERGGGWYNTATTGNESSPTVTQCKFLNNTARWGGAFYCDADESGAVAKPQISFCTFSFNTALRDGGAIYENGNYGVCSPSISNSIFSNNTASDFGDGIFMFGDFGDISASIINCLFDSNGEEHIGYDDGNTDTQPHFINCTFYGATSRVINIQYFDSGQTPIDFTNCLFENNNVDIVGTSNGSHAEYSANSNVNIQYSIVEEASFAPLNNNINADPLFKNGAGGDFRLKFGSPAINSGNNGVVPQEINTDLAGKARFNADIVDRGAYEFASRLYVNKTAGGNNNGVNWMDAFTSLTNALENSQKGTEVWVAASTYSPENSASAAFTLPDSVKIYGGFAGSESNLAERDWLQHKTILDGQGTRHNVVRAKNVTSETLLDGFLIQGGNAIASFPNSQKYGGGLLIHADNSQVSSPTIRNCTFRSNYSSNSGGAIAGFGESGGTTGGIFENCVIDFNTTGGSGGGLYFNNLTESTPVSLTNCIITGNAGVGFGSRGGGIHLGADSGNLDISIINCSIIGNEARYGGGIYLSSSATSLTTQVLNTVIWNNNGWSNSGTLYKNSVESDTGNDITPSFSLVEYSSVTGSGNLDASLNPLVITSFGYADAPIEGNDVRLTKCSPLINSGTGTGAPAADIFGNSRSGNPDIGAVEFQGDPGSHIIYVNDDAAEGGDGSSWAKAFKKIQEAQQLLSVCSYEDSVWVAAGYYYPIDTLNRNVSFLLADSTKLFGGFAGTENPLTFDLANRDFEANESILSGNIGNPSDSLDNSFHVVRTIGAGSQTTVDGFVIEHGHATGEPFTDQLDGAGWHNEGQSTVESSPVIRNTVFRLNYARNGAGLYNNSNSGAASPFISACRFYLNTASFNGAGISSSSFNNGYASDPLVENSIFSGNVANRAAGIYFNGYDEANPSYARVTNCLFTGNVTAQDGTAIYMNGKVEATIINSTFSGNYSSDFGSAISINSIGYNLTPVILNSIFWNNLANGTRGNDILLNDPEITLYTSHSMLDAQTSTANGNVPSVDPEFVKGLEPSASPSTAGDFRLNNCSPLADKGLNDSVSVSTDLAGIPRIFNDTGLPTAIVDLGAYEHQGFGAEVALSVTDDIGADSKNYALETINANSTVASPSNVLFRAGNSISLAPGFEAENSSVFKAEIGAGCP
ncbi:hypothetical protein AFM12_18055 [Jiulongibacter sediminis]|uniref:Right handed beta helix domain-containing protein n=2 Tax=Jiulongibacter sediminis TaxID=1605367 RepID=A0A0P7BI11_9BACT|nr:hypothetical protein AFM12_18055 [Jiulongibacter sediminis]TBX21593.1 hypothetical protein TK44_18060 [Jiulongibacter sediminis]